MKFVWLFGRFEDTKISFWYKQTFKQTLVKRGDLFQIFLFQSNEFRPQVNPNHCAGLEYNSKIITYCLEAFVVHIWVISSETVEFPQFRVPRSWIGILFYMIEKFKWLKSTICNSDLQFFFQLCKNLAISNANFLHLSNVVHPFAGLSSCENHLT